MSLLKHDQRGQEIADSEHNGAKSIYTIALKLYTHTQHTVILEYFNIKE